MLKIKNMFTKTVRARSVKQKSLSFFFEKSLEKDIKILDLESAKYVNFYIKEDSGESSSYIDLICDIGYENNIQNNNNINSIIMASFDNKENAEEALSLIKSEVLNDKKYSFKIITILGLLAILLIGSITISKIEMKSKTKETVTERKNALTPIEIPTQAQNFSEKEIEEQIDLIQKQILEQAGAGGLPIQNQQVPQPQQPIDPANEWLEKLK